MIFHRGQRGQTGNGKAPGPQPHLVALRVHETRRHVRPIAARQLAVTNLITPFGRTCQLQLRRSLGVGVPTSTRSASRLLQRQHHLRAWSAAYSITSSALNRSFGGISKVSAFAVLRFITNSNLVA